MNLGLARLGKSAAGFVSAPLRAPVLSLISALVSAVVLSWTALAATPVKFGAVLVLSGDGAAYGTSQKQGLELALQEINGAGGVGGHPLELVYVDTQGGKNQAVNGVLKLINRDRVLAIIGPTYSGSMFAAGPVANGQGVTIMGISTTAVGIGEIGAYVFRNSLPEAGVLPTTVKVAKANLGFKTASLLYSNNNDFAKSGADVFRQTLQEQGVKIVDEETFQDGDTDFRAQLTKVKAANPDVLVVSSLYKEAAFLLQQARTLGLSQPVLGGNGFNSPELAKIAGEAADGAIVGSPWFPAKQDPKVQQFVQKYTAAYGSAPDQFAAQAYDGLYLFAEALKHTADVGSRSDFRDALAGIKNFAGVTGRFSFDADGNPSMDATVLQIKNGGYVELK